MRWPLAAVVSSALLIAAGAPAFACDPDECDWWSERSWWDDAPAHEEPAWSREPADEPPAWNEPEPAYEPPVSHGAPPVYEAPEPAAFREPAPQYEAPSIVERDPVVWSPPGSDVLEAREAPEPASVPAPAPRPDAADRAAEMDLHRVTDVYAGDRVTTVGLTTTYSADTVSMDAGTYARQVATVGTGDAGSLDGLLSNARRTLSDGRLVAGAVYANYEWNGSEMVFAGYWFFQNDAETASLGGATVPAAPVTSPSAVSPSTPSSPATAPALLPMTGGLLISAPLGGLGEIAPSWAARGSAFVSPLTGDLIVGSGSVPSSSTGSGPVPSSPSGGSQPVHVVRAGVALAPQADPIGLVEVLRGRRVPLWVRATVDGAPARVVAWSLVSGELTAMGPISGGGDDPLVATWRVITRPGSAYSLRIRATVDVPGQAPGLADAAIDVVVRSPALVE